MVNYADGRAETVARSNGVDTAYGYDSAGRLTLSDPIAGAIRPQARGGSCQSACGEILTGGSKAERDLIEVVFELDDGRDVRIAQNGRHWAIEIDGVVVDNVNPGGLELAEWLRRLGVRPGSTINIEPA